MSSFCLPWISILTNSFLLVLVSFFLCVPLYSPPPVFSSPLPAQFPYGIMFPSLQYIAYIVNLGRGLPYIQYIYSPYIQGYDPFLSIRKQIYISQSAASSWESANQLPAPRNQLPVPGNLANQLLQFLGISQSVASSWESANQLPAPGNQPISCQLLRSANQLPAPGISQSAASS